jgi:hypothetical protein
MNRIPQARSEACTAAVRRSLALLVPCMIAVSIVTIATTAPAGAKAYKPKKPSAPFDVLATGVDTAVIVEWAPPTSDGGSAITGYRVTATPGTSSCSSTATTCTVTGLTNGRKYSVEVSASNEVGIGKHSKKVRAIATGAPDCFYFGPYANLQNCDLIGLSLYGINLTGANLTGANLTGAVLTGVTWSNTTCPDGTNSDDDGTCIGDGIPTVPDAPTDVVATAGDQSAGVAWDPGFDEGSAVTSYTVTASGDGGDETCTYEVPASGETDTCTVGGLTNGTSYTFAVTATNGVGTSLPSAPSTAVVPATVPDAGVLGEPH